MSRTYRRRGERHEYRWVLRDWVFDVDSGHFTPILDRSSFGRGPPRDRALSFGRRIHAAQRGTGVVSQGLRSPPAHGQRSGTAPLARGPGVRSGAGGPASPRRKLELVVA